jgi:hypothetical protein
MQHRNNGQIEAPAARSIMCLRQLPMRFRNQQFPDAAAKSVQILQSSTPTALSKSPFNVAYSCEVSEELSTMRVLWRKTLQVDLLA